MQILTISDLSRYLKQIMDYDPQLTQIWLRGEISNFKRHSSGHCYFTLKDSGAVLRSVMFRSSAASLRFAPRDGMKVLANGRVTVFERDGQYQLYVDQLRPEGVGELSLAYEQLKAKLQAEGLFEQRNKKELPYYPRHVGIITSPTSAALQDMLKVARQRNPAIPITIFPAQVQGESAVADIIRGIDYFNEHPTVDVLMIGRGGGSLEELNAFNNETLVRRIASCNMVTVSAVGHETDYTIADFVADVRAATPSQACELTFPELTFLIKQLRQLQQELARGMKKQLVGKRQRLLQLLSVKALQRPPQMLQVHQQQLDLMQNRLHNEIKRYQLQQYHRWQISSEKLAALNPLQVLSRGYSLLETEERRIVRSWRDVAAQEKIRARLFDGHLNLIVVNGSEE